MARKKYSVEFKTKIVLEILREEKQLGEIASEHNISPNQLRNWKKEFLENADKVFSTSKHEKELKGKRGCQVKCVSYFLTCTLYFTSP